MLKLCITQSRKNIQIVNSFDHFEKEFSDIRKNTDKYINKNTLSELAPPPPPKRKRSNENLRVVAKECDTVLTQLKAGLVTPTYLAVFLLWTQNCFLPTVKNFPQQQ